MAAVQVLVDAVDESVAERIAQRVRAAGVEVGLVRSGDRAVFDLVSPQFDAAELRATIAQAVMRIIGDVERISA